MTTVRGFAFSDGLSANAGVGHEIDLGSGLGAGQVDMLGVVSNAVVTTPSGWTSAPNDVSVAAMYVFRRTTGASGLVTIKTSADHPTAVIHVRLAGVASVDDAKKAVVSGVAATTSPTVTSATLLAAGEAAVSFALLHNWATAPAGPITWSGGFVGLDTDAGAQVVTQTDATASRRVAIAAAVHLNAGTAPVATAATWTNNATNRGTMMLTWQATIPGAVTVVGLSSGATINLDGSAGATAGAVASLARLGVLVANAGAAGASIGALTTIARLSGVVSALANALFTTVATRGAGPRRVTITRRPINATVTRKSRRVSNTSTRREV